MTCPNCSCQKCRSTELNAVLARRIVSRETDIPRDLSFVESENARVMQTEQAKSDWRDTVGKGR